MRPLNGLAKIGVAFGAALLLQSCQNNFTNHALGPVLPGVNSPCTGQTLASVPAPNKALLAAQGNISVSGVNCLIDSYQSSAGPYGGANRLPNGNVQASGNLEASGVGLTFLGTASQGVASNLKVAATQSSDSGSYILSAVSQAITVTAGDYYYDSINLSGVGDSILTQGGQVRIWFRSLNISGSDLVIGNGVPNNLWLIGTCGSTVNISGVDDQLSGVIYAPSSQVNISGDGFTLFGSIIGGSISLSSVSGAIHFDQSL